jgi:LysM repeat protein
MKIRLLLLLALVVMPCFVFAAQEEPTIYVIKQGDTLWGLSERFIKDPNYWPNMWSKNGQVTNPHFIYPGQKLRIFPDRLEFVPKEAAAAASPVQQQSVMNAEKLPLVAPEKTYTVYGTAGFLAENDFKPYGMVIGSQHDRLITGVDDIVYTDIGSGLHAGGGDKFSIFQKEALVSHPLSNEKMGYKMLPLGTLQLTDVEQKSSRAIVTKSFKEITPGSYLLPYKENRRHEIALKNSGRDLRGYILESYSGASVIAAGDGVYIDLGSSQGAEVGNMLYIVRDVTIDQKYVQGRIEKLPQELLGALVVIETGSKSATALIVKSIDAIYKGDRIVSQTK